MIDILLWARQNVLINFEQIIDIKINQKVFALKNMLEDFYGKDLLQTIPAYCSLTLVFKTRITDFNKIKSEILDHYNRIHNDHVATPALIEIPVDYSREYALDADDLEDILDMPFSDIIDIHQSRIYYVYMLGFLPGFAYMGDVDERISVARKSNPRTRVPAGSLAIADRQTAIYPSASPGGWHIIGHCDLPLVRQQEKRPSLIEAGMTVKFIPTSKS